MIRLGIPSVVLGLTVCVVLGGCDYNKEERLEESARAALDSFSKDPVSMQIRGVRTVDEAICGEVNLKNDQGNFQGFRVFIIDSGKQPLIAVPGAVHLEGWDRPLNVCASPVQRAAFAQEQEVTDDAFHRKIQRWKQEAELENLRLRLELQKFGKGE